MMKRVAQRHAQALNRREQRVGSFWADRFHSSIIQGDRYLLACYRYVEMNPVRAGLVAAPREYRWSSHRCNAEGADCSLITPHSLYLELGHTHESRQRAYCSLFRTHLDETSLDQFRAAARGCRAVGDECFLQELGRVLGVNLMQRRRNAAA